MTRFLKIAVVNPPYPSATTPGSWITVPPDGYGGIQWVVANLIDGLLALGHEVFLLGAPDSRPTHPRLTIVPAAYPAQIRRWIKGAPVDIVHDHTNGIVRPADVRAKSAYLSTHHLTGRPAFPGNAVYLSAAQRADAGATSAAPIVRIPVNVSRYAVAPRKGSYLLFLGRVSAHKGVYEAAAYARAADLPLLIAGPSWELDYRAKIEGAFSRSVRFLGEVGGRRRLRLLAMARAVLVLSQPHRSPWGGVWCEPGATVVSEAAASGTAVIATASGCLPELVPPVGLLVPYGSDFDRTVVRDQLAGLPAPEMLRSEAEARWGHVKIAAAYDELYRARLLGTAWR